MVGVQRLHRNDDASASVLMGKAGHSMDGHQLRVRAQVGIWRDLQRYLQQAAGVAWHSRDARRVECDHELTPLQVRPGFEADGGNWHLPALVVALVAALPGAAVSAQGRSLSALGSRQRVDAVTA